MNFEQIKELIELVAEHRLGCVELERSGLHLKIEGRPAGSAGLSATRGDGPADLVPQVAVPAAAEPAPAGVPAAPRAGAPPTPTASAEADDDGVPDGAHVLYSPIVGTFYAAPNPEASPFVQVGDRVTQGDVLCIVEAMKLMNEIEADVGGTVLKIYPKNSQAVEFGEPLFVIQPD